MNEELATAAVAVIPYHPVNSEQVRFFLGISRKDDENDFGFPGGKREAGESPWETAKRETLEEIGLDLNAIPHTSTLLYCGPDDTGIIVAAYLVDIHLDDNQFEELITKLEFNPSPGEGQFCIVTRGLLLLGSFSNYNKTVFEKL